MKRLLLIVLLMALVGQTNESPLDLALRYSAGLEFRPRNYAMRENERSLVRSLVRSLAQRGRPYDLVIAASGDLAAERIENVQDYLRELGVRGKITAYDPGKPSPVVETVIRRRGGSETAVLLLDPTTAATPPVAH